MHLQQLWAVQDASRWYQFTCVSSDERLRLGFSASQGLLSNNSRVELFLRGLLLFGPPALLLIGAPIRISQLYHAKLVTLPNYRGFLKLFLSATLFALQLSYTVAAIHGTAISTFAAAQLLTLVAYVAFFGLSILEHGHSVTPSTLLTVYLVISAFSDAVQFGLLYVAKSLCSFPGPPFAIFLVRLALLAVELQNKTSILREPYRHLAPEERAGFFGTAFFWWVNDIIASGYSRLLSVQDMPALPSYLDAMKLRKAMQSAWDKRKRPERRYTLLLTQFRLLWRANLQVVIPRVLFTTLRYCQPLLVSRTIAFVSSDLPPLENRNEAFRLVLLTFIIYTGMAIAKGMYDIRLHRLNVRSHMTIIGLIHNRCLTIKDGVFDDSAAVTLMSTDVERIMMTADLLHELWAQTLELCIGMYLLATELGWVCIVPLIIVAFTAQGSRFVASNIADRQKAVSMATQARISITKAVLDSMKNIKMMGLINKMEAKLQAARDHEIHKYIRLNRLYVAFNASAMMFAIFSPAVTLIIFTIQAELRGAKSIDVNVAFTSLAIISMVTTPANQVLVMMAHLATAISSYDRIQKYLTSPDREDKREILDKGFATGPSAHINGNKPIQPFDGSRKSSQPADSSDLDGPAISISDATIRPASNADPVLLNISTNIKKGSLVVCSGAVGTGKTTLAKAILGDLPPDTGTIKTAFDMIAYCSQTAWLPNGTIRDIILGPLGIHSETDQAWYKRVVHACDLDKDLHQFPDGDQTVIGSRGIMLSGGQKHRVALARAVYAHQNIIILDDVLSALDATTERHIVDNLIGPKGLFKALGSTVLLITHNTQHLPLADHIIILGEKGNIAEQGSWDGLRSEAGYISQIVLKEHHEHPERARDVTIAKEKASTMANKPDQNIQDLTRKTGDIKLYGYYFGAIGSYWMILLLFSLLSYTLFLVLMPEWLRRWAESGGDNKWYYSGIYILLTLGAFAAITVTTAIVFLAVAPKSGNNLHARLLRTVMAAPQSYFVTTDTGTTLNRFTADMTMIDLRLPTSLYLIGQSLFTLLSQFILLGVAQPLTAITLPFAFLTIYLIQKFYLTTSRQLRFLDLETKALVNSSFLETLEGVAIIRAFGWQRLFVEDNVKKLDLSLRPWYLLMCLQRWLNVVMDLTVLGIAMFVISLAVCFKGTTTGGQVGIALNVVLQASMYLLRLIEHWTTMETSLGAISRLRAFENDVRPEDKPGENLEPPAAWPDRGAIYFDKMSVGYNPTTLALKGVSVSIEPGKKVGLCGRTGSGKSSQLLSLLRLVEIESGTIYIDNLDVQTLSRNSIRSRLITVPQDPMLVMTDTVRQNLDIADSAASDEDIIRTLERVKLWSVVQSRASNAVVAGEQAQELDIAMGDGSNSVKAQSGAKAPSATAGLDVMMKFLPLSNGQQQLFSLARAMLMRSTRGKVVLLDEATSNVDGETDKLMQQLIREEFKEHTILTVAHRLDTIMDSDIVLVLDAGKLVEVGPPSELADKEGGVFRSLYRTKFRAA